MESGGLRGMGAIRNRRKIAKIESPYVKERENADLATTRNRKFLMRRLGLFFVFAVFVGYFMISQILTQSADLDGKLAQREQLKKELAGMKKQQAILKEDIVKLNDDDYIAKLARKEYFLSDKNEIIFNLPKDAEEK
jgi:cell division protein DivIC